MADARGSGRLKQWFERCPVKTKFLVDIRPGSPNRDYTDGEAEKLSDSMWSITTPCGFIGLYPSVDIKMSIHDLFQEDGRQGQSLAALKPPQKEQVFGMPIVNEPNTTAEVKTKLKPDTLSPVWLQSGSSMRCEWEEFQAV